MGQLTYSGQLQGKLYVMDMHMVVPETARIVRVESFPAEGDDLPTAAETALVVRSSSSKADADTWHCRLGHLNTDVVVCMVKNGMVKGMEISGKVALTSPCESCLKGKQTCAEILKTTETCANMILHINQSLETALSGEPTLTDNCSLQMGPSAGQYI